MGRISLTFWFTIATLFGPGVCCCSPVVSRAAANPSAAAKSNKSCCHRKAPPRDDAGKQAPAPGKPSKCPCEHGKPSQFVAPTGPANADLAAHLKLIDATPVGVFAFSSCDFLATISPAVGTSRPAFKLAGRDLLAAYSLLRC